MRPELLNYIEVFLLLKIILFYSKNGMLIAGSCSSDRASTVQWQGFYWSCRFRQRFGSVHFVFDFFHSIRPRAY